MSLMGAARLVAQRTPNLCAEGLISPAAAKFKRCVFYFYTNYERASDVNMRGRFIIMLTATALLSRNVCATVSAAGMAAVVYANRYAENYNASYPTFDGDCTNFVSQCVYAGGEAMIGSGTGVPSVTKKFMLNHIVPAILNGMFPRRLSELLGLITGGVRLLGLKSLILDIILRRMMMRA